MIVSFLAKKLYYVNVFCFENCQFPRHRRQRADTAENEPSKVYRNQHTFWVISSTLDTRPRMSFPSRACARRRPRRWPPYGPRTAVWNCGRPWDPFPPFGWNHESNCQCSALQPLAAASPAHRVLQRGTLHSRLQLRVARLIARGMSNVHLGCK